MTTQRSLRNILSHTAVVLLVVFSSACAQDLDAYRPQLDQLLADEAVAAIELGERWRTVEPSEQQPWPDEGARRTERQTTGQQQRAFGPPLA